VVGEAGDGHLALRLIRELRPQVAIVDIAMPGLDGFAVAGEVFKQQLAVELIFLTAHREESLLERALALGVKGYALKESVLSDIASSIRAVASGQHDTSPLMTSYLVNRRRRDHSPAAPPLGVTELPPAALRGLKLLPERT